MRPYSIIVHPKNSLFSTSNVMKMGPDTSEDFIVEQETMDKTSVAEIEGCDPDEAFSEDGCLMGCLADRFIGDFKCLNANLKRNERIRDLHGNATTCGSKVRMRRNYAMVEIRI